MPFHQFAGKIPILRFNGVINRFLQKIVGLKPLAGPPVQFAYLAAQVFEQ